MMAVDPVFGTSGKPEPKKTTLQEIMQAGKAAAEKAVDVVFQPQRFTLFPAEAAHVKAQFANGLEELRSVFYPGAEQVQPGNTPGLYGTPTTGEQTAERIGDVRVSLAEIMAGKEVEQARQKQQEMER